MRRTYPRGLLADSPSPKTLVASKLCSRPWVTNPWGSMNVGRNRKTPFPRPAPALIVRRSEIAALMDPAAYLAAVEAGFRSYANGEASVPMPMHIPVESGGFHAKGALVVLDRAYVAVKVNGNFPGNPRRNGLPTIQGVVLLYDAIDGSLLAIIDSIEITLKRTAAASALAARYLARETPIPSRSAAAAIKDVRNSQRWPMSSRSSASGRGTSTPKRHANSRARCTKRWDST